MKSMVQTTMPSQPLSNVCPRTSHIAHVHHPILDVVEAVANSPDAVLEEDILDECRSLLK